MNNRKRILKYTVVIFWAFSLLNLNISVAATADVKSVKKSDVKSVKKAAVKSVKKVAAPKKKAVLNPLSAYRLGPGDVLEISVWKEDGLQKQVLVRPDGGITFPLAGELQAGGKTAAQLQQAIIKKITKFIPDPVVTVSVVQVVDNHIYVIGKVNRPSDFSSSAYINVMQALTLAQGLNPFAKASEIKILRKVKGKQVAIPFDYDAVSQGEDLKQNITLKSGDVVVVP